MRSCSLLVAGLAAIGAAVPHKKVHHQFVQRQLGNGAIETDELLVYEEVVVEEVIYLGVGGLPVATEFFTSTYLSTTSLVDVGAFDVPTAVSPGPVSAPTSASAVSIPLGPGPIVLPSLNIPHGPGPVILPSSLVPVDIPPAVSTPDIETTLSVPGLDPTNVVLSAVGLLPATPTAVAAPPSAPIAAPPSAPSSVTPVGGFGLSYSPYDNNGNCKTQDAISSELSQMSAYSMVRIYGTDCDQTAMVLRAARAANLQVFAGVYDINDIAAETQQIIDAAAGDWSNVHTISIGNELINNGQATVPQVLQALATARSLLASASYPGHVVTVDTFVAVKANPQLCLNSDYAAVNCHPFFDGGVTAQQAGQFVAQQANEVSAACGGKQTFITETGWPWQGLPNGAAIPSVADQAAAIASLQDTFSTNVVLLSAFDELWKTTTASTFDAERYWGVLNKAT